MMRSPLLLLLSGSLALTLGCIGISGPADLERAVQRESGARLDRIVGLDVGGSLANVALTVASMESGLDLDAGRVDRVEVGVYEISSSGGGRADEGLFDRVTLPGWSACVKVRSRSEEVRVFLQPEDEALSGLAVLVRDGDEVVMVRVKGDLAPIAAQAIRLALQHEDRLAARQGMMRVAERR